MAIMQDADRVECWAEYMRTPATGETYSLAKADLRAALDAVDQWVSDNASAFNTAIPQPARSALSTSQKARLLMLVVRYRFVKGV